VRCRANIATLGCRPRGAGEGSSTADLFALILTREDVMAALHLTIHRQEYALTKCAAGASAPSGGRFASVSRLGEATTIVSERAFAPEGEIQAGFRLIEIEGEFALDSVGVVASVAGPLAAAGIGLFAFSVWSTDAFLIRDDDIVRAIAALSAAGHCVTEA
jgi:hypothetical protein